jgi:hypothetical protein
MTSEQPTPGKLHPIDLAKSIFDLLFYRLGLRGLKFRGAFPTYEAAAAAVRPGRRGGYDNDAVVDVAFDRMRQIDPGTGRCCTGSGAWGRRLSLCSTWAAIRAPSSGPSETTSSWAASGG